MNDASGLEKEGRFTVAVGAMVEHPTNGQVLMLKRAKSADYLPGIWEDIMGRMKQFEEPEEALRREVREESGLEIDVLRPLAIFHDYRGERTAENEWIGIVYRCKARSDRVVLSEEHSDYRWVSPQEALEMAEYPGVIKDIQAFMEESA